eukprot:SAG11_NODE_488_length_8997_cov_12.304113_4_plen_54_part_00
MYLNHPFVHSRIRLWLRFLRSGSGSEISELKLIHEGLGVLPPLNSTYNTCRTS